MSRPEQPVPALRRLGEEIVACRRCPRLVAYREHVARERRPAFREWSYWGRPVPGYGDGRPRIVLVGLAPAAHGSNRTGRMFTGDGAGGAGTTLAAALYRAGLASVPYSEHAGDGLLLWGAYLTSVVHCAPPDNRPTRTEIRACLPYLTRELSLLADAPAIVALGQVAYRGCWEALGPLASGTPPRFAHGGQVPLNDGRTLLSCYHPSRQNTQTGRLRPEMLDDVLRRALRCTR